MGSSYKKSVLYNHSLTEMNGV